MINRNTKLVAIFVLVVLNLLVFIFKSNTIKTGEQVKVYKQEKIKSKDKNKEQTKISKKIQEERIIKLVSRNADFFFVSKIGNNLFYRDQDNSRFYRYDLNSKKESSISGPLPFVKDTIWSPDGSNAVFYVYQDNYFFKQYKDPFFDPNIEDGKHYYWIYNFNSKKLKRIGENIYGITWTPDGKNIIYSYTKEFGGDTSQGIYVADSSFNNQRKISDLFFYEFSIAFLNNEEFLISKVLNEAGGTELYRINYKLKKTDRVLSDIPICDFNLISSDLVFLCLWDADSQEVSFKKLFLKDMSLEYLDENIASDAYIISDSGDYVLSIGINSDIDKYEIYKTNIWDGKKEKLKVSITYNKDVTLYIQLKNNTIYFISNGAVYMYSLPRG
uniref:Dipeptidylpeptidase IV N-terminal domain-containing protein n=1 Tax=candidate division CPR3 bacterium TaxID=2268181 RepID=A0A7C4M0C5_UNCC3